MVFILNLKRCIFVFIEFDQMVLNILPKLELAHKILTHFVPFYQVSKTSVFLQKKYAERDSPFSGRNKTNCTDSGQYGLPKTVKTINKNAAP